MAANLSELIKDPNNSLLRLGYSYEIKDALSHLQKPFQTNGSSSSSSTTNNQINGVLGLGTTELSSVKVRKFSGNFSDDTDEPFWRVELGYTHALPLVKDGSYLMAKINGESQATVCADMGHKVVPGSLKEEEAKASKNALGDEGFKVGCLLDMEQTGVEYLIKFFPLPTNDDWTSAHVMSLVNAGCLYAEVINGAKGTAIPMRILSSLKTKSGVLKVVTSLPSLNSLKKLGMPIIVNGDGVSNEVGDGSSTVSFPCSTSNYDYLKAEISDYTPDKFMEWCKATGGITSHHEILPPPTPKGESVFFVRLFIPESMREKAEYALAGKNFKIPENLYKTSSQINYTPGQITYADTGDTNVVGDSYEKKITDLTTKLFIYTGGGVANKGDGTIIYSQANRPHKVVPNKSLSNPYTDTKRRQLFELFKVINPTHHFTYDCSSFVQVLAYCATGLKGNDCVITTSHALADKGAAHMNQYLPDNYEAIMIDFDIKSVRPGDILARGGHCALFVGKNGYAGADDLATVEMHGINNKRKHTLKGSLGGLKTPFEKIIRIREKTSNNSTSSST